MRNPTRVREVFDEAADMAPGERPEYLDRACGGDRELRDEVESLLRASDRSGAFMSGVSLGERLNGDAAISEGPGSEIGRYTLVDRIGEGGFGTVFRAEQRRPVVRRVALKIVKLGMDTRQVLARFEAERQALAMMDHPGIAKVHDAGSTETGRPYFVMELVEGAQITAYCERERLTIRERLELFVRVCAAVQHAHQKGVIHRDLKPSNILVTEVDGTPQPKIIDFGIAKATAGGGGLTEHTLVTDHRQFVGTPEYMSPEQAGWGPVDVDTRSDIYALGVLLYELITGAPPFEPRTLRSASWEEMRRVIREDDPPKPSTRLQSQEDAAELAARRRADIARLVGMIRGDLDWIVMKCVEKDPSRRYETANGLAAEIGRHLAGEPVLAAPPSRAYRVRKFVRRNKVMVGAAVAVSAALLLGLGGTGGGLLWALHERSLAEQQAADLQQIVEYQDSSMWGLDATRIGEGIRESVLGNRASALESEGVEDAEAGRVLDGLEADLAGVNFTDVAMDSLREYILAPNLALIDEQFGDRPLLRAQLLQSVANKFLALNMPADALGPQEEALAIRLRELGPTHLDTLNSFAHSDGIYFYLSDFVMAEARAQETVNLSRQVFAEDHPRYAGCLADLGIYKQALGKNSEALGIYREEYELNLRYRGPDHIMTSNSLGRYAYALWGEGQVETAEPMLREFLQWRLEYPDDWSDGIAWASMMLGNFLRAQRRLDEAEPLLRDALERYRQIEGDGGQFGVMTMDLLSSLLRERADLENDRGLLEEAARFGRLAAHSTDTRLGVYSRHLNFAQTLVELGRFEEAEMEIRRAERELERRPQPRFPHYFLTPSREVLAGVSVALYEAWHAREPDAGHDAQAAAWRAELASSGTPDSD